MMKKPTLREVFTIPNLLSYFRLLLIPLFVWLYLRAQSTRDFALAAVVIGVSGFTDLFDGRLARRLNQITELGILLDPVYTGKAFAGMMRLLRQGYFDGQDDLLFVHTGGAAALFAIDLPR